MNIDRNLLKKFNLLYVEDDEIIRLEFSQLLSNFFSNIFVAKDGKEGLRTYLENQDRIDIILTDINMPYLNGIEMLRKIREIRSGVPVILATAHSDSEFLSDAIKLRVQEYVVKPIDVRNLLGMLTEIASNLYHEILVKQQQEELNRYKEIIDSNNIVIKTDLHLNITYVNELFCQISGYDEEELIGKELKSLKYSDVVEDIYTNLYAKVLDNKPWQGKLKNLKKDGGSYTTDAYVMPMLDDNGDMIGAISIQKDVTEEINKKREIQLSLIKDKSDIYIKSKGESLEQTHLINELRTKYEETKQELDQALKNVDKYMYNNEKLKVENKSLKTEVALYKKNSNSNTAFKMSKENSDLRLEIKKVKDKMAQLEFDDEKKLTQLKINHKEKISELEDKIVKLYEQIDSMQSDEVLLQKLEYWKEKAAIESQRVERLEKQIIAHADKTLLDKIFG